MSQKPFSKEFKDMLFKHKVIYIVLGFILYLVLIGIVVKDSPVEYFHYTKDSEVIEDADEYRKIYYGKTLEEAAKYKNEQIIKIYGYDIDEFTQAYKKLMNLHLKVLDAINNGNYEKREELDEEIKKAESRFHEIYNLILKDVDEDQRKEIRTHESIYNEIYNQIKYTEKNEYQNLRAENLFLGRGRFFGKDFNFIAILNFIGLEIALGLIAHFYIRKNDREDKKNKLLSFMTVSLFTALAVAIKQYIITKINYPGGIKDVGMGGIIYSETNFTLYGYIALMVLTWIVYYVARTIIYSKRAQNYDLKKSLMAFIIFNGLMFYVYFNLNVGTFVSLLGEGVLIAIESSLILFVILIIVAGFSLKAYLSEKSFIQRRRKKASTNS